LRTEEYQAETEKLARESAALLEEVMTANARHFGVHYSTVSRDPHY